MDIVSGLTAASTAIRIAKDLREIDKSVDDADFKLKLAELTSALADTKIALSDAKTQINALSEQLAEATQGPVCPVCLSGRLRVSRTVQHQAWSHLERHYFECDSADCEYKVERTFDKEKLTYN